MRKLQKIREKDPSGLNVTEEHELFASMCSKKRLRDHQQFDKFVDGNLSIEDYTAHLNAKTSRGHKRGPRDNLNKTVQTVKTLNEFFGNTK